MPRKGEEHLWRLQVCLLGLGVRGDSDEAVGTPLASALLVLLLAWMLRTQPRQSGNVQWFPYASAALRSSGLACELASNHRVQGGHS